MFTLNIVRCPALTSGRVNLKSEEYSVFPDKFLAWNLLGLIGIMFPVNRFTARDVSFSRRFLRLLIHLERIIYYCHQLS